LNELLLSRLILSLTPRRIGNIVKTATSFALSALSEKVIVWGIPPVLTIEPANVCNLRCPLCTTGSGEMKRVRGNMTLDTFNEIIYKFGDDIFFLLIYHQGEPYINPNFLDFVKIAKQKNIYVTTSTNGHYFTRENIKETIDSGLDSMIVSLDGITQETYAKYRVRGSLDKVIQGTSQFMQTRNLMKRRTPNVALQFLVMKHNEHEIPALRKLAAQIGVDRLLIKNIEVRNVQEANEWLPVNKYYRRYNFDGENLLVKGAEKKSCTRPWLSTLINWDGGVVPCCFDKNGDYLMGNIHASGEAGTIWRGDSFTRFRKQLLQDRKSIDICRNCNQGLGSFLPQKLSKRKKETSGK
jgi:radical SAM protein with 4Fe4S-binding SPASM domain